MIVQVGVYFVTVVAVILISTTKTPPAKELDARKN